MSWETHADKARTLENRGEGYQWQAKDEYTLAYEEIRSYDLVAKRVQRSHAHVYYVVTMVTKPEAEAEGWSFAEAYSRAKQKKPRTHETPEVAPPTGTYTTVVIDPPWKYDNRGTRGAANDHYPQLGIEELAELQIPAAEESHLYLWTTNAFLRDALDLVDTWGFDYKATLVWVKPQMGMGNYFRISHELVLFGIRGGLKTLRKDAMSWFQAPRGEHSAKPDTFYELVESCSPGPYMDMFNRDGGKLFRRKGWKGWGNEA